MRKTLLLVLALGAVAACKTDKPEGSASAPAETRPPGGPAGRSGKIELPGRRAPALPTDDPADDRGATEQGREERRTQRFAAMDTDGDGEISEAELEAARQRRKDEIEARLDTDGDGTVSEAERAAARRERAEALHTRLDGDGDGKLTAAELEHAPFRRFDPVAADDNGDGVVSVEELDKALQERGDRVGPWRRDGFSRGGRPGAPAPQNPVPTK